MYIQYVLQYVLHFQAIQSITAQDALAIVVVTRNVTFRLATSTEETVDHHQQGSKEKGVKISFKDSFFQQLEL